MRRAFDYLGWPGALACVVMLGVLAAQQLILAPLRDRQSHLEQVIADSAERVAPGTTTTKKSAADTAANFFQHFAKAGATTDMLAELYAAARRQGLAFSSARYETELVDGAPLTRLRVSMPVQGSYPQIRAFFEDALREIDTLVIDQVSFRRAKPEDAFVEAELEVSLFSLSKK